MIKNVCIVFLLFFAVFNLLSDPWESTQVIPLYINNEDVSPNSELFSSLGICFVHYYQDKVSTNSINRCPFYLSCSNYTLEAFKLKGAFWGVISFIDRAYFRENFDSYNMYPLKSTKNGILKLDDMYYLYGEDEINEN